MNTQHQTMRRFLRWQSGMPPPRPPIAAAGSTPAPSQPSTTSQILHMWKSGGVAPAAAPAAKAPPTARPLAAAAASPAAARPSLVNSLANIRAEMERNRRLQAERRTQVEKLEQEKRVLQERAREMRRGMGSGRGERQPNGGGALTDTQWLQQQQQQQQQQQHQSPGPPQLGLSQGAGLVSNFSGAVGDALLQGKGKAAAQRARPVAAKGGSKGGARGISLARSMRGLRLRVGQRITFERGHRTRQGRTLTLFSGITIRQLAIEMRIKMQPLFQKLAAAGETHHRSPSDAVDCDVAQLIAEELGMVVRRRNDKRRDRTRTPVPSSDVLAKEGAPHRAPVVTVMGHVDHGKTSLLDALRSAASAAKEAGGITQAIAAFSVAMRAATAGTGAVRAPGGKAALVRGTSSSSSSSSSSSAAPVEEGAAEALEVGGGAAGAQEMKKDAGAAARGRVRSKAAKHARQAEAAASKAAAAAPSSSSSPPPQPSNVDVMTFIDTPGHALFSSMRRHGSSVTDIVVLVVDGKDGPQPQTLECMELITSAAMPCVVAVTKCDTVDPADATARVAEALLKEGFATEPYGGDVPLVPVSARTGFGLEDLKAALAFQAELLDLRARAGVLAEAVVLDSRLVAGQGQVVDAIVGCGTLRVGDVLVADGEMGRVKALFTDSVGAQSLNRRLLAGAGAGAGAGRDKGEEASGSGGLKLQSVREALPGTPVRIVGLKGTPAAGADLLVVEDEARAVAVLEGRARRAAAAEATAIAATDALVRSADRKAYKNRRDRTVAYMLAVSRERQRNSMRKMGQTIPPRLVQAPWEVAILAEARTGSIVGVGSSGKKERVQGGQQSTYSAVRAVGGEGGSAAAAAPVASLLLRADSMGSLAALKDAVGRIAAATDAVVPRVVTASVGDITEKDVVYAADMGAHIVGFGARASAAVAKLAEKRKVRINAGKVIYHVLDSLCEDLGTYLPAEMVEEVSSVAEVRAVFSLNANNKAKAASEAAGCVVTAGTFLKAAKMFRLVRDGEVLHSAAELGSLQHLQKKVESVKKGDECGISLAGFVGIKVGDRIEAIAIKRKALKINVSWD